MGCCITFTGVTKDCEANIGGIKRAWIACYENVTKPTVTADIITAIGKPVAEWKEFEFNRNTGSVETTFVTNDAGKFMYNENTITLVFDKQETAKRIEINALALSDLAVIIEDRNGKFWYYGYDNYVVLTDGSTATTGTVMSDTNQYIITLVDTSYGLPYEVSEDAMGVILNPAAKQGASTKVIPMTTTKTEKTAA